MKRNKAIENIFEKDNYQQELRARVVIKDYYGDVPSHVKEDMQRNSEGSKKNSFNVYLIDGKNEINDNYEFNVVFVSNYVINIIDIENLDVELNINDVRSDKNKNVFGKIVKVKQRSKVKDKYLYEIKIVHPFNYLKYTKVSKIYHDKKASQIIQEIISKYVDLLNINVIIKIDTFSESVKEYVTQYKQSDYEFVQMICNEEGYSLVLNYEEKEPYVIEICNVNEHCSVKEEVVFGDYNCKNRFESTNVIKDYYEYTNPQVEYKTTQVITSNEDNEETNQLKRNLALEKERYVVNKNYSNDLKRYTNLKSQKQNSKLRVIKGVSKDLDVTINKQIHLKDDNNKIDIIVLKTQYKAVFPNAIEELVEEFNPETQFEIRFKGIEKDTIFKPNKKIKKTKIKSILTAIVSNNESNTKDYENSIDVDDKGRIKVLFHFETNQTSSCYLRYSNFFSGNNYGSQFLPRINSEVIVSFINGNPNMPIIIGALYNGDNKIPYELPVNHTKSYIKTYSLPQYEDKEGYNELLFEDKRGGEELNLRAQRDMNIKVLNDKYLNVENNHIIQIDNNKKELIKANSNLRINKNYTKVVNENEDIKIDKNKTLLVQENYHKTINQNYSKTVNKNQEVFIKEMSITKVLKDTIKNYDKNYYTKILMNKKEEIKKTLHLTTNEYKIDLDSFEIDANVGLTIRCGANALTIDSNGIHIKSSNPILDSSNSGINLSQLKVESDEFEVFEEVI